jgi:hypothetical protein
MEIRDPGRAKGFRPALWPLLLICFQQSFSGQADQAARAAQAAKKVIAAQLLRSELEVLESFPIRAERIKMDMAASMGEHRSRTQSRHSLRESYRKELEASIREAPEKILAQMGESGNADLLQVLRQKVTDKADIIQASIGKGLNAGFPPAYDSARASLLSHQWSRIHLVLAKPTAAELESALAGGQDARKRLAVSVAENSLSATPDLFEENEALILGRAEATVESGVQQVKGQLDLVEKQGAGGRRFSMDIERALLSVLGEHVQSLRKISPGADSIYPPFPIARQRARDRSAALMNEAFLAHLGRQDLSAHLGKEEITRAILERPVEHSRPDKSLAAFVASFNLRVAEALIKAYTNSAPAGNRPALNQKFESLIESDGVFASAYRNAFYRHIEGILPEVRRRIASEQAHSGFAELLDSSRVVPEADIIAYLRDKRTAVGAFLEKSAADGKDSLLEETRDTLKAALEVLFEEGQQAFATQRSLVESADTTWHALIKDLDSAKAYRRLADHFQSQWERQGRRPQLRKYQQLFQAVKADILAKIRLYYETKDRMRNSDENPLAEAQASDSAHGGPATGHGESTGVGPARGGEKGKGSGSEDEGSDMGEKGMVPCPDDLISLAGTFIVDTNSGWLILVLLVLVVLLAIQLFRAGRRLSMAGTKR